VTPATQPFNSFTLSAGIYQVHLSGDAITPPTIEPLITAPGMKWDTLTTNSSGTLLIVGGTGLFQLGTTPSFNSPQGSWGRGTRSQ
jgi:hypothetical protein